MKKCPVCKKNICTQNNDGLCLNCGWDFYYYLAGFTRSEEIRYKKKLKIARRNWRKLVLSVKEVRMLKKHIDELSTHSSGTKFVVPK
jgi:hypothetical protein